MSKETALHPEILDGLDYEQQFIQTTSTNKNRRVGGLKPGDSWLLRFIPAQMGPKKQWYARIAQHWMNKKAIFCPRQTAREWNGDPEAYCPVCEAAERLNNDKDKEVGNFGYRLSSTPQWRTWVVVMEKAVNGGAAQEEPMSEILRPYEFNMYRTGWEELTGFVRKGARRCPLSVFDYEQGNDFWLSKLKKGTRLDKEDSAPIFDLNSAKFDEWIDKIEAACKDPVVKMPSDKQMEDFADKALEEADNIGRPARGRGGERGGRGAVHEEDGDDLPEDRGRGRGEDQDAAPRGRSNRDEAPRRAAESETEVEAPVQEEVPRGRRAAPPAEQEETPRGRSTRQAPARKEEPPAEDQPRSRRAAPAPEPAPEEDNVPMDAPNEEPAAQEEQPVRRAAAPAAPRPSSSSGRAPAPSPRAAATRTVATPARGGNGNVQESIDPDENIPEEATDQAPARRPLIAAEDDQAPEQEEAPPETPRRGALGSSIRNRVAAVTQRTAK